MVGVICCSIYRVIGDRGSEIEEKGFYFADLLRTLKYYLLFSSPDFSIDTIEKNENTKIKIG
ncbi:hypothetical protein DSM107003_39940 [Trichormus variabilis SAG 1403-4b]|uniref:Uncharacterized protein n=1 Tax=Trichormus variabilis SAG 1403-4b TaxID=447716 RepID=A0A433UJU0_ANAVA|nr:hypothetical protein DSM107003_39940 [Trichormus variabilis SAG 1403-4b]